MDAVVTAGGIPQPDELLYPYTLGKPKALLEICGKPMVQWVLNALGGAKRVENVILIGLTRRKWRDLLKTADLYSEQDKHDREHSGWDQQSAGDQPFCNPGAAGILGYSRDHFRNGGLGD